MTKCTSCGVMVEDGLQQCPLCGADVTDQAYAETEQHADTGRAVEESAADAGVDSTGAHSAGGESGADGTPERRSNEKSRIGSRVYTRRAGDLPPAESTVRGAKIWLFEILSLIAFTAAIVVFAADFAYGFAVSWARYPLVCIGFVWLMGSVAIALARHLSFLLLAETIVVVTFLFVLGQFIGAGEWFFPLALPITLLVAAVFGSGIGFMVRLKLSAFQNIGVIFLSSGLFLIGLEAVINKWSGEGPLVSWSLVAFACTLSLFFLMLLLNRRLKKRHAEYRRIFHL
jgi:hypothetical protein